MAEILSAQYKSVFTIPTHPKQSTPIIKMEDFLLDINIEVQEMEAALHSISNWSAHGPDEITPTFLKEYSKEIAPALCHLWRKSLDSGVMPDDINLAYITPLFKGGTKSQAANYRPVALTNHITKAFEKIVKNHLISHLTLHQLLNITQHGFCAGRSTLTNLIDYYESILNLLEYHQSVDSIYLDYSKAFDKCDHNIILDKLHYLGIGGKVTAWIEVFLKRRQQQVVVRGSKSSPVWCTSGVPQGSVLGPILFLILMIDITKDIVHALLSSFADDTKVLKGINSAADETLLQNDLHLIYEWAERNNMKFNSEKFQAIRFAELLSPCIYKNDANIEIKQLQLVKDLGIHVSQDMQFDCHIRTVASKGRQMAGWILRTFRTRSPTVMLTLLKQLIYPTIEYNSVLWSPSSSDMINLLESVQRNFLKKIVAHNIPKRADYRDLLKTFKLYSLQRRRERYAIIYTWKVVHNFYPNPGLTMPAPQQISSQGIQINVHQRDDITVHHDSHPPK